MVETFRTLRALLQGRMLLSDESQFDQVLTDIHQDSRCVTPGSLFLAMPGTQTQGDRYIDSALRAGAVAIIKQDQAPSLMWIGDVPVVGLPELNTVAGELAARFFGNVSKHLKVIGVTGTNGKSSVTHFIAQLADALGETSAVMGTLGVGRLGVLRDTGHTTPSVTLLHRMLRELYDNGVTLVAMEVSSHALDQGRVSGVCFRGAVLTNITQDHLDYHGTMAAYSEAKRKLMAWPGLAVTVLNLDDPYGKCWSTQLKTDNILTYSTKEPADLAAHILSHSTKGTQIDVIDHGASHPLELPLLGDFNVSNFLAASAVLQGVGFDLSAILSNVSALHSVSGRMEEVVLPAGPKVIIDYAHTPDALQQTLFALRAHCTGQLWCVFGCGGDRDPGKRALMGEIASRLCDRILVTDDNPRSEDPDSIARAIVAGCVPGAQVDIVRPREKAILQALQKAAHNDWILIAGKGHETYQEIQGVKYTYSDHAMVQACWDAVLNQRPAGTVPEVSS